MKKQKKYTFRRGLFVCVSLLLIFSSAIGVLAETDKETGLWDSAKETSAFHSATFTEWESEKTLATAAEISPEALKDLKVYPGGMAFGVRFQTEGVTVANLTEIDTKSGKQNPGKAAGLQPKDVILKADGEELKSAADLTAKIEKSDGKCLTLSCKRGTKEFETTLTPVFCPAENRYKTGIWVRDTGAGIGTVTFVIPETNYFAGLGHGITNADTGELVTMRNAVTSDVVIQSVVKGQSGSPGELKGFFQPNKTGVLLGNSPCGVWGKFSSFSTDDSPMEVGLKSDLSEGDATILCTLADNTRQEYAVKISAVNYEATGSKCFTVTVTDEKLLAQTGGIVQGMSGSPILQNGKIVGAVTHVLVNHPDTGYGIFLENMLVRLPVLQKV